MIPAAPQSGAASESSRPLEIKTDSDASQTSLPARTELFTPSFSGTMHSESQPLRSVPWSATITKSVGLVLFAVASLAPIPFGSISPLVSSFWLAILSFAALAAMLAASYRSAVVMTMAALVACAYIGLALLQTIVPPGDWAFSLWPESSRLLGRDLPAQSAAVAYRPLLALDSPLLSVVSVICGIAVASRRTHVRRFLSATALFGVGYAGFGLVWFMVAPGYVLWWPKQTHVEDLTATFTNRNTAAVFIGIALIILTARASAVMDRYLSSRHRRAAASRRWRRDLVLIGGQIMICLLAIMLTNSRAGGLLSLLAATVAGGLRLRRRYMGRFGYQVGFVGLAITATIFVIFALADTRLSTSGLEDGGRFATYRATLQMALDHPWLGVGLGCFSFAFPLWRDTGTSMWGVWNRAHNSLLELAAEAGLPFAGLIVAIWLLVLVLLARSAWRRRDNSSASLFAICSLGLAHSLVDFSIQIPGFQIAFYALVGIGLGQIVQPAAIQSSVRRQRNSSANEHSATHKKASRAASNEMIG